MVDTQTRYTRKKKKKEKRFGFGLSLWDPKKDEPSPEHQPQQQRLLRPRTTSVRAQEAPSTRLRRGFMTLSPDDRALFEQLRDVTKRSLGDDSVRLDSLVDHLKNAGFEVNWIDETDTIPGHWKVTHPALVAQDSGEEDQEDGPAEEEDPVVRQDPPQEPEDDTA